MFVQKFFGHANNLIIKPIGYGNLIVMIKKGTGRCSSNTGFKVFHVVVAVCRSPACQIV